jgi:hypothetical protein
LIEINKNIKINNKINNKINFIKIIIDL